jgi:LSD1 subclass zinc finger protein
VRPSFLTVPHEAPAVLLICPNCRSGLEVPDGTTALVRCPACKTVFAPADGAAHEEDETDEEEQPKAKPRKPARDEEAEDDRPRKKRSAKRSREEEDEEDEDEPETKNRDFDPETEDEAKQRKKRRKPAADDSLTPEERAARRAAFERAAWGCRLIWISFALFMLSMVLIIIFYFQLALVRLVAPSTVYITLAGVLGLLNWIVAAVGIGLCLSGPRAPGHWGYGISAAVATAVHLVMVLALVSQGKEPGVASAADSTEVTRWELLPTRLDATMFYLTMIVYQDQGFTPKGQLLVSMITGVVEMTRTVLIMMMLSCLARAALDEDLAHKCTRAAGIASGGPGLIALIMFLLVAALVETNAGLNLSTLILITAVKMGIYSILAGVIMPAFMTAREVNDACDEPFQSLIPQL